jgi:hypothetical protein
MGSTLSNMAENETIYIPEQFDHASEFGYLRRHEELTRKFQGLFERGDKENDGSAVAMLSERNKDEWFYQACKDVARTILLHDDAITTIEVGDAQALVEEKYNAFLENPELAGVSRASAVH